MLSKKKLKDRKKKVIEDSLKAGSSKQQPANIIPLEAPAGTVSSSTCSVMPGAGTDCTDVPPQLAQPQLPADASSLRMVPIYDLDQLPIDCTTGDRFIPRLDLSWAALQNMRLIPIYDQNLSPDASAAPSLTASIADSSAESEGTANVSTRKERCLKGKGLASKSTYKEDQKKIEKDATVTNDIAKESGDNRMDDAAASTYTGLDKTATRSGLTCPDDLTQRTQSSLVNTSSPPKLVPIYNIYNLPIDVTTGKRILPRLDTPLTGIIDVRLVPFNVEGKPPDIRPEETSTIVVAPPDSIRPETQDNKEFTDSSAMRELMNSEIILNEGTSQTAVVTGTLEVKNNKNLQLQLLFPGGLSAMNSASDGLTNGLGSKLVLEGNEDMQVCAMPHESISTSTLKSGCDGTNTGFSNDQLVSADNDASLEKNAGELTIKNNKNLQIVSAVAGALSLNNESENTSGSTASSSEMKHDDSRKQTIGMLPALGDITQNKSSQIMAFSHTSSGTAENSSSIIDNQDCQIMSLRSLIPATSLTDQSHELPKSIESQQPSRDDNRQNLFAHGHLHFTHLNHGSLKPFSEDRQFPLKRFLLSYEVSSKESQDVLVDVYDRKLRISTTSPVQPLHAELEYSEIKGITSDSLQHLQLTDQDDKITKFTSTDNSADHTIQIVTAIVTFMSSAFPSVPLQCLFLELKISPERRSNIAFGLCQNPARHLEEDISKTIVDTSLPTERTFFLAKLFRQFPNEHMGLLKTLKYNKWFTRFHAGASNVTQSAIKCVAEILENNVTLEAIDFSQARLHPKSIQKLAIAMVKNTFSKVVEINISNNIFSKDDVAALSFLLGTPNRGFRRLIFENSGMTTSSTNLVLREIHVNGFATALSCLNLSGLKRDFWTKFRRRNTCQGVLLLLRTHNQLQELNLSGGGMALEEIISSLAIGCLTHLRLLELEGNFYGLPSSEAVPPKWRKFFSMTQNINRIGFSNTRLPAHAFKAMLKGISENESVANKSLSVHLDVSNNNLGLKGAEALSSMTKKIRNIRSLNITNNGLKNGLPLIFESFATYGGVEELSIGKNFTFLTQNQRFKQIAAAMPIVFEEDIRNKEEAIESLIDMIKSNQSHVKSLDLTDSKLGPEMSRILYSLKESSTITRINISGNNMGDKGAQALAEVLSSNTVLTSISFDRNNLSIRGLEAIAEDLWRNPSLQEVAFPLHDIARALKKNHKQTLEITGIFSLQRSDVSEQETEFSRYPRRFTTQKDASQIPNNLAVERGTASTSLQHDSLMLDGRLYETSNDVKHNDMRDDDISVGTIEDPENRERATNSRTSTFEGPGSNSEKIYGNLTG